MSATTAAYAAHAAHLAFELFGLAEDVFDELGWNPADALLDALEGALDDIPELAVETPGDGPLVEPRLATPSAAAHPGIAAARRIVLNAYDGDDARLTVVHGDTRRQIPKGSTSHDVGVDDCEVIVAVRRTGPGPRDFRFFKVRMNGHTHASVARHGDDAWATCVDGKDLPEHAFQRAMAKYWADDA